jgi:succinoglycan biosynthesis transport protein ExoP
MKSQRHDITTGGWDTPVSTRPSPMHADDEQPRAISRAGGFIRRRGLLIAVVSLPLFLCLVAAAALLPPRYVAEAKIVIDPRTTKVLKPDPVLSSMPTENEAVQTAVHLLASNDLVRRAVEALSLREDPELNPPRSSRREGVVAFARLYLPADLADVFAQAILRDVGIAEDVLIARRFQSRLRISQEGRSYVLAVRFTADTPERAARLANGYAELFVAARSEERAQATEKAFQWLSERVVEARHRALVADAKTEEFRRSHNLIRGRDNTPAVQEVTEMSTESNVARSAREAALAKYRKAEALFASGKLDALGEMQRSPIVQQLRGQEAIVLRRLGEVEQLYGAQHPEVLKVRAELAKLRVKIANEAKVLVESLQNDAGVSESVLGLLTQAAEAARERVAQENEAYVTLRALEREAAAERGTVEALLIRLMEVAQEKRLQPSGEAKIASRADPPGAPASPNMMLLVPAAAGLSLFLAILVALYPERFRRGIRSMQEIAPEFGFPALALLPYGRRAVDQPVTEPYSGFVEGLRHLYAGLPAPNVEHGAGRSILVTSSVAEEGKTTIALGLGRLIALGQRRVVLVDADLRRSGISRATGSNRPGLAEVLSDKAQIEDVLTIDPWSGLSILPAGSADADPAFLLGSLQMETLLRELRETFETVIVDSPPIIPVADALHIARAVDLTIMVTQWERTPRETTRLALRQLLDAGAAVAGIAISQVRLKRHSTYGYADSVLYGRKHRRYYQA